jgi:D-alanyl-D-alanine carboxypeptidase
MSRWFSTNCGKLALVGLAAMVFSAVFAACGGREEKQVSKEVGTQLQQILDKAVADPKTFIPGTALHVAGPELGTWAGAAGRTGTGDAAPMRADTRFAAGSIMKPFVATAVLQLAEEGKLGLDDRLPTVLPRRVVAKFPDAERITVRMLLNHRSGIAEFNDEEFERMVLRDPRRVWTDEEYLDRAAALPPMFAPGARGSYSNTNYTLLGFVIEQATGEPWRSVVREQVVERAGMKHTSLPEPGASPLDDGVHGYEMLDGKAVDTTDVDASVAGTAGGNSMVTTTEDLSRFLEELLAGELFERPETLEQMLTFVDTKTGVPGSAGYGLGIERYVLPGGLELYGHFGTGAGFRAFVARAPAQELDVAMAINSTDDPSAVLFPALELAAKTSA